MSDIIERLKRGGPRPVSCSKPYNPHFMESRQNDSYHTYERADALRKEAADEIVKLRAENKKLGRRIHNQRKRLSQLEGFLDDRADSREHYRKPKWFDVVIRKDKELSELKQASEWKTIDSAPKDGTDIIVFDKFFLVTQASCSDLRGWQLHDVDGGVNEKKDHFQLTHWKPLPDAPKSSLKAHMTEEMSNAFDKSLMKSGEVLSKGELK